ncbi:putative F-box-like domain superfamily protein [Dioscorea sansibarensis]
MALAHTTTIEDLHPDLVLHTLRLLDGPALAAASCATTHLHSVASHPDVWHDLCLSIWPSLWRHPDLLHAIIPSFAGSHHSFFSQAYPFPFLTGQHGDPGNNIKLPKELLSAVDIYYKGVPILSRVIETETESQWFTGSPFRVDVLDRKDPDQTIMETPAVITPGELTLSWIVIDPEGRKAVNLSSRRPVTVDRHWYSGETVVKYAMTTADRSVAAMIGVTVACEEEGAHVRELSLMLEDEDGICLNGKECLAMIKEAMEGEKLGRGRGKEEEQAKQRYEEHMERRKERKERRARNETRIDTCCIAIGVSIFLAFMVLVVFR